MAIFVEQQHSVDIVAGDAFAGDGKSSYHGYIAWPHTPTVGNWQILWVAPLSSGFTAPWASAGWTEIGSFVPLHSPYTSYGLRVWKRQFAAGDATSFDIGEMPGTRYAAGLIELSGAASISTTSPTSSVASASIPSYTLGPALSITATATTDLLVWIGFALAVPNDGTQELTGVTFSDGVQQLHIAPPMGERLGSGDVAGYFGWAGTLASPSVAAHSSAPTWAWYGGGTTKPNLSCVQRGLKVVAA